MRKFIFFLLFVLGLNCYAQPFKTKNVILVTIDGFRWEEVFTGADTTFFANKKLVPNTASLRTKYAGNTSEDRRKILLPFIWNTIFQKGQIYGNRLIGCNVNVENPYWFSYPGYNEILTGIADPRVNSNEFGPNPNTTFLEAINKDKGFNGKIAVFTSWDAFNDIVNEKRSGVLVNAAVEHLEVKNASSTIDALNQLQSQLPDILEGVRLDGVTFNIGFEYLKQYKPRVLYLAFDETDDFAHEGRYDLYLNSAHYTDGFLQQLWDWVQNTPEYKDQTTLLITCDHGRGTGEEGWRSHGSKTPNSDETWFAVIGPDTPAKGEIQNGQFYNKQYAKTLSKLLGFDYTNDRPVGDIIMPVIGK
jgi:hypothetical protein